MNDEKINIHANILSKNKYASEYKNKMSIKQIIINKNINTYPEKVMKITNNNNFEVQEKKIMEIETKLQK